MEAKLFTCLNGSFVLAQRAAVAVADRGFRYGDGVFETIRVERGVPYQWEAHIERLRDGLRTLSITQPVGDFMPFTQKLLKKNNARDGFLRIAVTRGAGSRGYAPHPPKMPPTWIIEWHDSIREPDKPCTLFLSTLAQIPPQCLPTHYKLAQGLNHSLAIMEANARQCDEALQLTPDGIISSCSSGNLFWVHGDTPYTPALSTGCLAGVTRESIIRFSPLTVKLVSHGISELEEADALFMTNSRVGIWPIAGIQPMGWKFTTTHKAVRQLQHLLSEDRQRDIFAGRSRWVNT